MRSDDSQTLLSDEILVWGKEEPRCIDIAR